MTEPGGTATGKLSLTVDHGVIEVVRGDRSLLPADMTEPEGMSLLELVHPVDRERIASWQSELPGVSPVFRRAQAEEPPRWFELVAASAPVGGRVHLLLVEVTPRVRELDRIRRVMGILARSGGEDLLLRVPAVAMEVTGTTGALLADIHGPLAVVRSVAGEVGIPEGAALTVSGSPLEAAIGTLGSRVYEDGLGERFPTSALVKGAEARSAAVVPVQLPEGKETIAALAVLSAEAHRFSDVEREVLETLAARAGLELARLSAAGNRSGEDGEADWRLAYGLASKGAINAFGNLLAAIGLNCELILAGEDLPPSLIPRLDRIAASVARGGKLVHLIGLLSAPFEGTVAPGRVDVVLGELADLLPLCAEGLEMEVVNKEAVQTVWASEKVLYSVLSALVLAAAESRQGGLRVVARLKAERSYSTPGMIAVELAMAPRGESPRRRSWDPVPAIIQAVRRLLALVAGEIGLEVEGETLRVELGLVEVRPDESGPHRRVR